MFQGQGELIIIHFKVHWLTNFLQDIHFLNIFLIKMCKFYLCTQLYETQNMSTAAKLTVNIHKVKFVRICIILLTHAYSWMHFTWTRGDIQLLQVTIVCEHYFINSKYECSLFDTFQAHCTLLQIISFPPFLSCNTCSTASTFKFNIAVYFAEGRNF